MPKVVCIIQARTGSTRLPGKVLLPLGGRPLLSRVVERILEAKRLDAVVVATTEKPEDNAIVHLILEYHPTVPVERGSEDDCLDRYYQAAKKHTADVVVRVTGDNPFIDPDIVDHAVDTFLQTPFCDFVSNNIDKHTYPRGLDTEVIAFLTLEKLWGETTEPFDREHTTTYIKRFKNKFVWRSIENNRDLSHFRCTVDEDADYRFASAVYGQLFPENPHFRMNDLITFLEKHHEVAQINAHIAQRNQDY